MERKAVSGIMLILMLIGMLTLALDIQPVKASGTVYIRADGSIDPPDAPISTVDYVTYILTGNISGVNGIVVERSNIIIDGAGYTLQGTGSGMGFYLLNIDNVTITRTNIKGFSNGVYLDYSSNNILFENDITAIENMGIWLKYSSNNTIYKNNVNATINYDGIYLQYSSNFNSISSNNLTNNRSGVQLSDSSNNSISGNKIANNNAGVWLRGSSNYDCIEGNNITANNYYGILLLSHYNNIKGNNITANGDGIQLGAIFWGSADYNSISENNIIANDVAIAIEVASSNRFYHNNFIDNNRPHFILYGTNGTSGGNIWDNGYPSGGNYWSGYEDTDQFSGPYQNETGSDGICDTSYILSEYDWGGHYVGNIDYYPLMGQFSDFAATPENHVQTICNSTISDFQFDGTAIRFNATGEDGTIGFCRICIPRALMDEPYRVFVDGTPVAYVLLPDSNSTHSYLYFTYNHSTHEIIITSETPPPTYTLIITTTVGGTTNPAPGTYSYAANSAVQVTAIPNTNYLFNHWELDSVNKGSANPYTVLMDKDHTLKTVFSPIPPPKPVGGYSFQIEGFTAAKPLAPYIALIVILAIGFTTIRHKTKRKTK